MRRAISSCDLPRSGRAVVAIGSAVVALTTVPGPAPGIAAGHAPTTASAKSRVSDWTYRSLSSPDRVKVFAGTRWLATFTSGARTVTMTGPRRVFAEGSTTTATVTSKTWVRLLPQPFGGTVDKAWLRRELKTTRPDVLRTALQYRTGAPTRLAADGKVLASDADYGPLQADGTRSAGSDFNDYLGVTWSYPGTSDAPEADQLGALDCSGFVRMVFGYRRGLPLTLDPNGKGLPRRAEQMAVSAPGVIVVPDSGMRPRWGSRLRPGDLVFFDASIDDGSLIDHVGIYLGIDSLGAPRFISSRKIANGPTMGDVGGRSVLSGTGRYATAWREARRL